MVIETAVGGGTFTQPDLRGTQLPVTRDVMMFALGELSVPVEKSDGEYLAIEDRTGTYGEGDTAEEAFLRLVNSLVDLRAVLRSKADSLAPELRADLEYLDQVLWA